MNGYLAHYLRRAGDSSPETLPSLETLTRDYVDYLFAVCARDREEVYRILAVEPPALARRWRKIS